MYTRDVIGGIKATTPTGQTRSIILDVDTGIDDAWALVYAALSPTLNLMGVTTVFGNADLNTTTRNTLAVLDLLQRDIPVFRGADRPLLRPWEGPVPEYHGHNGLGDAPVPDPKRRAETLDAAHYIRTAVREHPGELTLVMVARLTNLARALLYDPSLAPLIDRVVLMGGAAFCPGNVTAVAEANIWGDPEAADLIFQSNIPITMVGLDVTMQAAFTKDQLGRLDPSRPYASLLGQATAFYMAAYESGNPAIQGWCPLHDPLAVAVAEDPSLVKTRRYPVRVETQGRWTDGMTVVDARHPRQGQVEVATQLDLPRFLTTFHQRVGVMSL